MTDRDPQHLAVLARSWNTPPDLQLHSDTFTSEGNDKDQRAYLLTHTGTGKPAPLAFEIQASQESPVFNLALVIRNWGEHGARLTLNGQAIAKGKTFRVGHHRCIEGTDLIAWIKIESLKPVKVSLVGE